MAAADALRLLRRVPPMVRLGVHDSLHPGVRGLHIDVLAERQAAQGAKSLESLAGETQPCLGSAHNIVSHWAPPACSRLCCFCKSVLLGP